MCGGGEDQTRAREAGRVRRVTEGRWVAGSPRLEFHHTEKLVVDKQVKSVMSSIVCLPVAQRTKKVSPCSI